MTAFESGREVISEINGESTISELIGLLISSFQSKEFKQIEGILKKREDDLKLQLEKEKENCCILQGKHADAVFELFGVQEELKKIKNENLGLREELKTLKMEKLETARKFLDYELRVAKLEKAFQVDVLEVQKKGNSNLNCEQTPKNASDHDNNNAQASFGAPSPTTGPGSKSKTNSCHEEEKGLGISCGFDDSTSKRRKGLMDDHPNAPIGIEGAQDTSRVHIDIVKLEEQKDSFNLAAASKSIHRSCDTPRPPHVVEIIDSDDEAPAVEKQPNITSKNGLTFVESVKNACPLKRKIDLTEIDDIGMSPVCKQRIVTATREELHRDGKASTPHYCSVKLESRGSSSQFGMPCSQKQMENEQCQGSQRKPDSLSTDDSSVYSSSDSDNDDCSESHINKMVQSLKKEIRSRQNQSLLPPLGSTEKRLKEESIYDA